MERNTMGTSRGLIINRKHGFAYGQILHLFRLVRAKAREFYLSECKNPFSLGNKPSAFESEIHRLHKPALRASGISLLHTVHRPKKRASETNSGSCRNRADSSHAERNPLTEKSNFDLDNNTAGQNPCPVGLHTLYRHSNILQNFIPFKPDY